MFKRFTEFVMPRPMVLVSLLFIFGILLQGWLALSIAVQGLLVPFLGVLFVTRRYRSSALYALIILSGSLRLGVNELTSDDHLGKVEVCADSSYLVRAIVDEIGETRKGTARYKLKPESIGHARVSHGFILLYSRESIPQLEYGDTLLSRLRLQVPRLPRNPHEFDYHKYALRQGIYYEGFIDQEHEVIVFRSEVVTVGGAFTVLRLAIKMHFDTVLSSRSSAILSALILGDKDEIDSTISTAFANTGVIHVLAVSGLHVGYVTLILVFIMGIFRLPYHFQMSAVIIGLLFYVMLTGAAASVMRASVMASLVIISKLLERKSDVYNLLSTAAFVILMIAPQQLYNIGFQLSFLAVLSIVSLFPVFKKWVGKYLYQPHKAYNQILIPLIDLFLVSLAAQLGTLAMTVFYFHKVPVISLIANVVVVPLIGVTVATGMSLLILGTLIPPLAILWAATLEGVIDLMLWFVQLCASFSWSYVSTPSIELYELGMLLIMCFTLAVLTPRQTAIVWIIGIMLWININQWKALLEPPSLEVIVLDVGQGDALLIHTPQGKTVLVDAGLRFGGKDMGRDVIAPYMDSRGWRTIDLLVLTHPHNDHMGGAQYMIENYEIQKVLMPEIDYESYGYSQLRRCLKERDILTTAPFAGEVDSTLKPLYFRVMGPKRYDPGSEPSNVNNTSLILQWFYGQASILLPGDGEKSMEIDQLAFGPLLNSDVIKAPHHGSKTSSSKPYIHLVQAKHCLISLGLKNKFEHPSPMTLANYANMGTMIHRTDEEGAIVLKSDGIGWRKVDWKAQNY